MKRNFNKNHFVIFCILIIIFIVAFVFSQIEFTSSSEAFFSKNKALVSSGGGEVPTVSSDSKKNSETFEMMPGRIEYDFENKTYYINIRRINEDNVEFIVIDPLDNATRLLGEDDEETWDVGGRVKKENEIYLDLNGDGVDDVLINLKKINNLSKKEKSDKKSAEFTIERLEVEK